MKQLVQAAVSLGGPKLDKALWRRLEPFGAVLPQNTDPGSGPPGELPADLRMEVRRLRALVAEGLLALGQRLQEKLAPALAGARQAWDTVDSHIIVDVRLETTLSATRYKLERAAERPGPVGAVAVEGLLALESARGLTTLAEQRMSSLIRLRVRQTEELLPDGRPFLDLGAAITEAARAWA